VSQLDIPTVDVNKDVSQNLTMRKDGLSFKKAKFT